MRIAISPNDEIVRVPDLFGNLDLPESERLRFVFTKPQRFSLGLAANTGDGIDKVEMIRKTVKRIENPPELEIGDKTRPMTFRDVFIQEELSELAIWVAEQAFEILNTAVDKKK
jgi:hypothetical protein